MKEKYISENCIEYISLESVYIENAEIINNELHLTFDCIEVLPQHPLSPFDTVWETNKAKLIFYDFEVLESGYYECSNVKKQKINMEEDCMYIPLPFSDLINDFTIVYDGTIKERIDNYFEHYFEGFAWKYKGEWGIFKIRYSKMEARWDSFYNE